MAITQIRIDLFRVCFLPTANAFSKAIAINVDARIIKIKKEEET